LHQSAAGTKGIQGSAIDGQTPPHLESAFVIMGREFQQALPLRQRLLVDKGTLPE